MNKDIKDRYINWKGLLRHNEDPDDKGGLGKELVEKKELNNTVRFIMGTEFSFSAIQKVIWECAKAKWLEPLQRIENRSKPEHIGEHPNSNILTLVVQAIKSINDQNIAEKMILEKDEEALYSLFTSSKVCVFTKNLLIEKISSTNWVEMLKRIAKEKNISSGSGTSYDEEGKIYHHTVSLAKEALKKL